MDQETELNMNTPQPLPLAKRITQGEGYHWQGTRKSPDSLIYFGVKLGANILYMGNSSPKGPDAELIAEAFNVTHETGKTPRQLADELKDASIALQLVKGFLEDLRTSNPGYMRNLVLQDYAQMNEAFLALDKSLTSTLP